MTGTVKISALPAGSALAGAEAFAAVQGTATVKLTASQLKSFANAGVGTVTSVALSAPAEFTVSGSPVTGAGALSFASAAQSANTVWAGPGSGAAAAPAFRALGPADLPAGSVFVVSATIANVAATGDVATLTLPVGLGDYAISVGNASNAIMRAFSNGASGAITGTIRTAPSGGGVALYTFNTVTPPAAGALSRSTAFLGTTLLNQATTPTLYINVSASTATGAGAIDVPLMRLP
ncbi:MAG TPA: hypothetical protein VHW60_04285, partial [Caulobacteraceae bacterium]|nr:hypothetical protein [Caulobacteraceae bacterium]